MAVIDVIYQFQGIVGATLGVVATLIVTQILHNIGKLYFYNMHYELERKNGNNRSGNPEMNFADCKIDVQIYNNSESMKVIRNIQVAYVLNNGENVVWKPHGKENSGLINASWCDDEGITYLNLPAKSIIEVHLRGNQCMNNLWEIDSVATVYLKYETYKGKKKKHLIWKRS